MAKTWQEKLNPLGTYPNSMLKILTIAENSVDLHQVSRELHSEEIISSGIQQLIDDMIAVAETTVTAEGYATAGLSAVQVGEPLRLFIAKNFRSGKFFAYLNPKIDLLGKVTDFHAENCLSIPGTSDQVSRHKRIRISYTNRQGTAQVEKFDGFEARILQHEYDHLNGILFTERVKNTQRIA